MLLRICLNRTLIYLRDKGESFWYDRPGMSTKFTDAACEALFAQVEKEFKQQYNTLRFPEHHTQTASQIWSELLGKTREQRIEMMRAAINALESGYGYLIWRRELLLFVAGHPKDENLDEAAIMRREDVQRYIGGDEKVTFAQIKQRVISLLAAHLLNAVFSLDVSEMHQAWETLDTLREKLDMPQGVYNSMCMLKANTVKDLAQRYFLCGGVRRWGTRCVSWAQKILIDHGVKWNYKPIS